MQLGAFLAGAILAETNFRTQIEADIRPFRGLLIGLFFLTTGTSIDLQVMLPWLVVYISLTVSLSFLFSNFIISSVFMCLPEFKLLLSNSLKITIQQEI